MGAQNANTGSLEIYATAGNPLISHDRLYYNQRYYAQQSLLLESSGRSTASGFLRDNIMACGDVYGKNIRHSFTFME